MNKLLVGILERVIHSR